MVIPRFTWEVPDLQRTHTGQHDESCFACKLSTLMFSDSQPKTHSANNNPWKNNPVADRITELSGGTLQIDPDIQRSN